jgi:hypothetical protein
MILNLLMINIIFTILYFKRDSWLIFSLEYLLYIAEKRYIIIKGTLIKK